MQSLLVVDDDRTFRETFIRELRAIPELDIHEAPGGGHALRLLAARSFDLIIVDIHMPLVDGFMVLRTLRAKPGLNEKTPICVVTSDGRPETRKRAMELGASMFITKPLVMSTAIAVISGRLRQSALAVDADDERR